MNHPVFARLWRLIAPQAASADDRRALLDGLHGEVVELGAGTGANFAHYPRTVSRVLAIEPEPYLRRLAEREAAAAPVHVDVVDGLAESLPAPDSAFDGAVAALVLCSVSDQARALSELQRVLKPDGTLHFYEHVVADRAAAAAVQRGLDDSGVWPRVGAGCHLARDTVGSIEAAGFAIVACRRFTSGPGLPHVAGRARPRPT